MDAKTIVVADDEADMVAFLKQALEGAGYNVLAETDGKNAIETTLRVKPRAVLLDILMPVVQGYDVCRYLRGQSGLGGLKIVFLSSLAGEQDAKWGLAAGADAYLAKPVGVETLLDTVRRVLDDA